MTHETPQIENEAAGGQSRAAEGGANLTAVLGAGFPGERWEPSNSTDGYAFLEYWCTKCQRDKAMREGADIDECDDNEKCEIIAASFRGEAAEWRRLESGECVCTAFVPAGEKVPERCPMTADMFEPAPNAKLTSGALAAPETENLTWKNH